MRLWEDQIDLEEDYLSRSLSDSASKRVLMCLLYESGYRQHVK